jgi:hypothetical protein
MTRRWLSPASSTRRSIEQSRGNATVPLLALLSLACFASPAAGQLPSHASGSVHTAARSAKADRLAWRPPRLRNPVTVHLRKAEHLDLDPSRDYILRLPARRALQADYGCVHITGGHNVVLIGGACYVPRQNGPTEGSGRVFYVEQNTGTVHIEGLYAYGPGLTEGIDIFSPRSILEVENCRFEKLNNWGLNSIHSDLIQADSLRALRVDRFTGKSQVQGIFRQGSDPAPAGADLRHVNISTNVAGASGGRALWQDDAFWYPMRLSDFYLEPPRGRPLGQSVWPGTADREIPWAFRAVKRRNESIGWRRGANITGVVHPGRPRSGDFVQRGVAGLRYVSPGYN